MVREFIYTSSKGIKPREVLVFKETDKYIEGIDLSLLSPEVSEQLVLQFKDYKPTVETVKIEGWDPAWNIAWRKFLVSKMG